MSKTLNGSQSLPSNIFIPPTFQYYLDSPASLIACFTFPRFLFYFKLHKISYNLTPLVTERILSMKEGAGDRGVGVKKKYCGPGDHRAQYCQKVFVEMYFKAFPINFNFLIKACLCWYFRVVLTIISKSKKCFIFSIIFKKSYSKKFFIKFLIFFAISKFICRNKIKLIN